jgi:hypothetical protein
MKQKDALAILKTGANVFLTGEPGSGKTHTVNQYIAYLRSRGVEPAITASTGIAATHIGGLTIHSWSGIGVRPDLSKYDLDHIGQNKSVVRRISTAQVLIIDEVSMLSARTLGMVDAVCREVKRSTKTFGGLQVVLVGDFFQLPPVYSRGKSTQDEMYDTPPEGGKFAFSSPAWGALNPLVCYLSEQHRQEDAEFLAFLSALRRSMIEEEHVALLRTRYFPTPRGATTQLYSHNADVDRINDAELEKISGEIRTFSMTVRGPERIVGALKRGCLSPEELSLKEGARVMFTKNDVATHRYVNGTLGTVVGFSKDNGYPIVRTNAGREIVAEPDEWRAEDAGRTLARISQVPLRLAWAMTVHKSQGMSLDAAHMDLSQTFEYGQGYVALSRVRTLAGLSLAGLNKKALRVHPDVCAKDEEFRSLSQEAREAFEAMASKELAAMHENFIRACGGLSAEASAQADRVQKDVSGSGRAARTRKVSTYEKTKVLALRKLSLEQMAKERGMAVSTIMGHLEKLAADGSVNPMEDFKHLKPTPQERFNRMKDALQAVYEKEGKMLLAPAKALLGDDYTYDELHLTRLFIGDVERVK